MVADTRAEPLPSSGAAGPVLVFGFATAVAMWCLWLLTHHPALALPASVNGPLLLVCLLAGSMCAGRFCGGSAWKAGLGAGVTTSLLNLLILGMFVVKPPTSDGKPAPGFEGLVPSALVAIPGFLALGAVIGLFGAAIGARLGASAPVDSRRWLARFAVVAAIAVFPLLLLGGAVTSTASGMAVPGWPDSYGANMFLYPISLMGHPRIFLEHSHRLFGALVGLTTVTLMIFTLAVDTRRWVKGWAIGCFVLVCIQGYLGGQRVNLVSPYIGAVHGVSAQLFLAMVVALAAYLSPHYVTASTISADKGDKLRKVFAGALLHSTILQLIFGALYRHVGQVKGTMHSLWAHAGFSIVVVIAALVTGFSLRARAGHDRPLGSFLLRLGTGIMAVVTVQFLLGWAAFYLVLKAGPRGAAPQANELDTASAVDPITALVATVHQGNGALLLALAALAAVFTRQILRAGKAQSTPAAGAQAPAA